MLHLTRCPKLEVPPEVWELIELAEFFEKGLAPVSGGVLEQVDAFLKGCRAYWRERDRIKAEILET